MYFRFGRSKKFDNVYILNFKTDEITDDMSHGIHMNDIVGENISKFDVLCIKDDGKFYKADAKTNGLFPAVALATEDIEADNSGRLLISGYIRNDNYINLDPGKTVYLDINGTFSQQYPPTDRIKQVVGYGLSEHILFFNPDLTYDYHRILYLYPTSSEPILIERENGLEYYIECNDVDTYIQLFEPSEREIGFIITFIKLGNKKLTILSSPNIYLASDELNSRIINETFERFATVSLRIVSTDRYVVNSFDGTWAVYGPNE